MPLSLLHVFEYVVEGMEPSAGGWQHLRMLDKVHRDMQPDVRRVMQQAEWRVHAPGSCGLVGDSIPRSTLEAPAMMILHVGDDIVPTMQIVESTRWLATPNGLDVTDAFRWPGDIIRQPHLQGHEASDDEDVEAPDDEDVGEWADSFTVDDSAMTELFVITVQLFCVLPRIVPVDGMVDVTKLPAVFRSAVRLRSCAVASSDYPAGMYFAYRRMVKGSLATTVREVWDAVTHAEGWDKRCADDYDLHYPGIPPELTVREWFDEIQRRDSLRQSDLGEEAPSLEWIMDGCDTMHIAWPACRFQIMHNTTHPHAASE